MQQDDIDANAAEAEARAFKDRLVDYDRNARQRTKVVDDQNDFFEIDTNAWLEPQVCPGFAMAAAILPQFCHHDRNSKQYSCVLRAKAILCQLG